MNYVYRFENYDHKIIYIGKTGNIKNRLRQHFGTFGHLPAECYDQVEKVFYAEVGSAYNAEIMETYLIQTYHPIYNDEKKYRAEESDLCITMPELDWKRIYFDWCYEGIRFHDPNVPYPFLQGSLQISEQFDGAMMMCMDKILYHPYKIKHDAAFQDLMGDEAVNGLYELYQYADKNRAIWESDFSEDVTANEDDQASSVRIAFHFRSREGVPKWFGDLLSAGFVRYEGKDVFSVPMI